MHHFFFFSHIKIQKIYFVERKKKNSVTTLLHVKDRVMVSV